MPKGVILLIDRSVPYFDVIMVRPASLPPMERPVLPQGYTVQRYLPGSEMQWCDIETSVGEFDTEEQAAGYFGREFLPYQEALANRMVFLLDGSGETVATATAWWAQDVALGHIPLLHWVATKPGVQGMGLGRAVTQYALSLFPATGSEGDIWLSTQTWSHVAIALYLSLGFRVHRTHRLKGKQNGYEGALPVLKGIMRPEAFQLLEETAIG